MYEWIIFSSVSVIQCHQCHSDISSLNEKFRFRFVVLLTVLYSIDKCCNKPLSWIVAQICFISPFELANPCTKSSAPLPHITRQGQEEQLMSHFKHTHTEDYWRNQYLYPQTNPAFLIKGEESITMFTPTIIQSELYTQYTCTRSSLIFGYSTVQKMAVVPLFYVLIIYIPSAELINPSCFDVFSVYKLFILLD